MGCASSRNGEYLSALAKRFPVNLPSIPGDVLLAGELPKQAVESIGAQTRGWLYLNAASDPNFFPDCIKSSGTQLQLLPFNPAGVLQASSVALLVDAIHQLPRPLVIQCSNRGRSCACFLLWLADMYGYRRASVEQLAIDLELDVPFDTKQWLQCQLPAVGSPEPLVARSPEVRQLHDGETCSFMYVVHCLDSKEAIIIDPTSELRVQGLKLLKDHNLQLKYVLFTDHSKNSDSFVSGSFRESFPHLEVILPEGSDEHADVYCKHGDSFSFGSLFLEVRGTPGYTRSSVTYVLNTKTARFAFTGYALLVRGCGRRISGVGDRQVQRLHYHSVQEQILSLAPDTIVCPRFDVQQRNVSTVREERRFNPRFNSSEDYFIQTMESSISVRPLSARAHPTPPTNIALSEVL